jgi:hypothetical protein
MKRRTVVWKRRRRLSCTQRKRMVDTTTGVWPTKLPPRRLPDRGTKVEGQYDEPMACARGEPSSDSESLGRRFFQACSRRKQPVRGGTRMAQGADIQKAPSRQTSSGQIPTRGSAIMRRIDLPTSSPLLLEFSSCGPSAFGISTSRDGVYPNG